MNDAVRKSTYLQMEAVAYELAKVLNPGFDPETLVASGSPAMVHNGFVIPAETRPLWTNYLSVAESILNVIDDIRRD